MNDPSQLQAAPALTLADFTSPVLLLPRLSQGQAAGVIQELSQALARAKCIPDLLPFYHAALNREFLVSSAMDYGMAFPHARLNDLDRLWFALGRSDQPIAWGNHPVRWIFLFAVPALETTSFLHVLSAIARLAKTAELIERWNAAATSDQMAALLKEVHFHPATPQPRLPQPVREMG